MCKLGYIICVCKICLAIQCNNLSNCVKFSQEDAYFLYENMLIFLYTRLVKFFLWCTFGTHVSLVSERLKSTLSQLNAQLAFRVFLQVFMQQLHNTCYYYCCCVIVWCCVWNMHHIVWKVKGKGSGMENTFYSYFQALHTHNVVGQVNNSW